MKPNAIKYVLLPSLLFASLLPPQAVFGSEVITFQRNNFPDSSYQEVYGSNVAANASSTPQDQENYTKINYDSDGQRFVCYFDISQIPSGTSIVDARLEFNVISSVLNPVPIDIFQVTTDWRGGASWNNPGGDWIDAADQAQGAQAFDSTVTGGGWKTWNVTAIVQHWISGTHPNYGFLLKSSDSHNPKLKSYGPGKTYVGQTPRLVITYEDTGGDTTPPSVSNVTSDDVTDTTATVNWTTDEASTSQVDYGTTSSYGSSTPINSSMLTAHTVPLSGLDPSTTYHYRVRSQDAAGNEAVSGDYFFTTTTPADTNPPTGTININAGASITNNASVTLSLSANDAEGAVTEMKFANGGGAYSSPEAYNTTKAWTLSGGDGTKTVNVKYKDEAGNWSGAISDTITLDTTPPTINITSHEDGEIIVP